MLGSGSLEIATGIVFVYLLLSLICTSVMEAISSFLNKRGSTLFEGVKNLLNDPSFTGLAQQIYSHGLVSSISQFASDPNKPNRLPSYMPSKILSSALVDILSSSGAGVNAYWTLLAGQRQSALDDAQKAQTANPGNASLAAAVSAAQLALADAQAKVQAAVDVKTKHDLATDAAGKVKNRLDLKGIADATTALAVALDAGRSLAAECPDPLGNVETAIRQRLPAGHTKDALLLLVTKTRQEATLAQNTVGSAERQIEALQANVEHWYNDAMDRVTGWYKRWTQLVLVMVAVIVVGVANADTIMLAKVLTHNDALRASIAGAAVEVVQGAQASAQQLPGDATTAGSTPYRDATFTEAGKIDLPLGWFGNAANKGNQDLVPTDLGGWAIKVLGLIITIAAVSLGAPFWFDTLSKFVNIRGAGTPPGQKNKSGPQRDPSKQ